MSGTEMPQNKLYHLFTNVSEMTTEKGDAMEDIIISWLTRNLTRCKRSIIIPPIYTWVSDVWQK